MNTTWRNAFLKAPGYPFRHRNGHPVPARVRRLEDLKTVLDWAHIKIGLLRPYFQHTGYPLVEARELLPSFDVDLFEYRHLPGYSLVAFERPLDHFREFFQYDILHPLQEHPADRACQREEAVLNANLQTVGSRLPRHRRASLERRAKGLDVCALENYLSLLPDLLHVERGQVMALDAAGDFCLAGIFASFPSDLDAELKRFGIRIGKFQPGNNVRYEHNRLFVYQFLMELYGFPIVSERRTSAALFARRLMRTGERFLVRVQGQSDRVITTLSFLGGTRQYPQVEKIALVQVPAGQPQAIAELETGGYFVDPARRVIILRVRYQQHRYNPKNVQEDRALSVSAQEVIHPRDGHVLPGLNIIQDSSNMLLVLNDIVRGEYRGAMVYRRNEVLTTTEPPRERLKFLSAWLAKHQRRIIGYSAEFHSRLLSVLDSYLLAPGNIEHFERFPDLHREVWEHIRRIQQSRTVRSLQEAVRGSDTGGEPLSYLKRLKLMTAILDALGGEGENLDPQLRRTALTISRSALKDGYLQRTYLHPAPESLTPYGLEVRAAAQRFETLIGQLAAEALPSPSATSSPVTSSPATGSPLVSSSGVPASGPSESIEQPKESPHV